MIPTLPGFTTTDRLAGVGLTSGLVVTARLRDGDEILSTSVVVTPALDADGDVLPAYVSTWQAPASLPVILEYLVAGVVIGADIVVDQRTVIATDGMWPWAPSLLTVAAILRARTRGPASRDATIAGEQGVFTATTRPTANEVLELIAIACGELAGMMQGRTPCTTELTLSAASAAAYRTAQLVEVSYYPEQTNAEQSAFRALDQMWGQASRTVALAVNEQCPITPGGGLGGDPLGRVPLYVPIGWGTRW
jgi:hypothetical protein